MLNEINFTYMEGGMKKLIAAVAVVLGLAVNASAADTVVISGNDNFPVAYGCASDNSNEIDCTQLANGTTGEVVKWTRAYMRVGGVQTQLGIQEKNQVKILNGPSKGKTLYVKHIYMTLK